MTHKYLCFYILLLCFTVTGSKSQNLPKTPVLPNTANHFKDLEKGFITIPDSVQTVYTGIGYRAYQQEGVVKDLEAMKKVGINRPLW